MTVQEANEYLKQLFEEVEQYRALGTVEELKEAREKQKTRREWYQKGYQDGLNATKRIPCEERLPSEHGEYLVTHKEIKDGKIRYRTNYDVFNATTKKWIKAEVRYAELEVVAWQEDIPPYEETKEREGKCQFEQPFPRGDAYICKKTALICTAEKLKFCKYKEPYKKEGAENKS